jgi:hypothetical protein
MTARLVVRVLHERLLLYLLLLLLLGRLLFPYTLSHISFAGTENRWRKIRQRRCVLETSTVQFAVRSHSCLWSWLVVVTRVSLVAEAEA